MIYPLFLKNYAHSLQKITHLYYFFVYIKTSHAFLTRFDFLPNMKQKINEAPKNYSIPPNRPQHLHIVVFRLFPSA